MDKITVNLYGQEAKVPRGDMTDKEWKEFKSRFEDKKVVESKDNEDALKGSKGEYRKPIYAEDLSLKDKQILDSADMVRTGFVKTTPGPDKEQSEKSRGVRAFVQQGVISGALKAAPDAGTPEVPGSQKRSFPAGLAAPATPEETQSLFYGNKPDQGTPLVDAAQRVVALQPAFMVPGGQTAAGPMPAVPGPMVPPAIPTMVSRAGGEIANAVSPGVKSLGQLWGKTPEGQAMMAPRSPVGPPPTTVGMPGQPSVPPPGAGSMTSSASVKATVPGGGAFPEQPNRNAEMDQAVQDQVNAARGMAEVQTERDKAAVDIFRSAQDRDATMIKEQRDQEEFVNAKLDGVFNGMMEMQKTLQDPSKTPDPERYWKNHSKILFAIGVGLLAANNRDISGVLGSVNQAIDRDIDAQQKEFDAPKKAARESWETSRNMYGMLRSRKFDAYESRQMERAIAKEMYANQIEQMKLSGAGRMNDEMANQMAGRLREDATKIKADLETHSRANAINEFRARTDRFEAEQKYAYGPKGAGKKKLSSEEQRQLEFSRHGRETIAKMKALLGPVQGLAGAMGDEIMRQFPLAMTNAKERDRAVESLKTILATDLAKSSLQAHEQKRWLEGGLLGGVGLQNQSQKALDELYGLFGNSEARITGGDVTGQSYEPLPTERPVQ